MDLICWSNGVSRNVYLANGIFLAGGNLYLSQGELPDGYYLTDNIVNLKDCLTNDSKQLASTDNL
jgi:hypothetical protein